MNREAQKLVEKLNNERIEYQKQLGSITEDIVKEIKSARGVPKMEYIDRIKKIKSEKKITNEKLSEMTGIPLGTLSKIMAEISDSPKFVNI